MKKLLFCFSIILSAILYAPSVQAQQYAVTEDGRSIILYNDGTWEYLHSLKHHQQETEEIGRNARIITSNEIIFFLIDGQLDDVSILTNGVKLYDKMSGKLRRIGPHEIEYEFHTDRLKRVGKYAINYDFHTGKVKKIGEYPIEYDFHTGKISRIGNTHFEYSFFHGKLTDISGNTPGIDISVY